MTEQELDAIERQHIFEILDHLRASGHDVALDADMHVIISPPVHADVLDCLSGPWHDVRDWLEQTA